MVEAGEGIEYLIPARVEIDSRQPVVMARRVQADAASNCRDRWPGQEP
jgi:hypothetical protein